MQKSISLLLTLILFSALTFGQKSTLSGKITDSQSGEPLYAATVLLGTTGIITQGDGTFSISVAPGEYDLTISYVGYESQTQKVQLTEGQTQTIDVKLSPEATILNTATVTAGKHEKPLGEVTVSLEVLKPSLIENTSKPALDKALEKIPGVTVIDGQANIRGGSGYSQGAGSRVLLLVDDVPILQADAGFPNWDDVPIENIEQIEVVKGAASALYGSSALNGIVNVRTAYARSEPETKVAAFSTVYFSPKDERLKWWDSAPYSYAASISHKRKFDKLDLVVGGFYINENSYNKDTYKEYGRFNFNTRYRITDRLSIGLAGNINAGKSGSFFYWLTDTSAYVGNPTTINNRKRFRYNLDPHLTYFDKGGNRHRVLGRIYKVDNDNDNNQANKSSLWYAEYQFQRHFSALDLVLTAGIVGSGTSIDAELYGDTSFSSRNFAGYLQLDKEFFDRLNVSAGFRYEDNLLKNPGFTYAQGVVEPSNERESQPVFRLGLNYRLLDYTYVRASWGQGYRFPTVAEKFIVTNAGGFYVLPNPTLQSETGWTAELGIKQGFRLATFEGFFDVAAFVMRYSDMMEFNLAGAGFRSINIGDTETKGFEISIAGRGKIFNLPLNIITGYTYIDPHFLDFDPTPIPAGETGTIGQINANNSSLKTESILKYRSRNTFKLDLETQIKAFSLGIETFYNSKMEAVDAAFLLIVNGLQRFRAEKDKGVLVHNVRAAYNITKQFKASLIFGNVFNNEYAIRPGLLDAPRNLTARLDYNF